MLNNLNALIFHSINQFATKIPLLDDIFIYLAKLTPFIFIFLVICIWFLRDKKIALYSTYSAITGILTNYIIAKIYFHPRPFTQNLGTQLIHHAPDASFPSDHTTFVLSIAFCLLFFQKTRTIGLFFSLFGIISGIARIFVGVHYPFDIFGSIIVAIISSILVFLTKEKTDYINIFVINLYGKIVNLFKK